MKYLTSSTRRSFIKGSLFTGSVLLSGLASPAVAQVTAFMQAVAETASRDNEVAAFYKSTGYAPIWTGRGSRDRARRQALLKALDSADDHGLPQSAYDTEFLKANLRRVRSERDLGRIEVQLSQLFLRYATDVQTGMLNPRRMDEEIFRNAPLRNRQQILANFSQSSPEPYIRNLPPQSLEYTRLMKQKFEMERLLASGGWAETVRGRKLEFGQSGARVVALRNRLVSMGYMSRSASQVFDERMQEGVLQFQSAHGLNLDGVVGPGTMKQINASPEKRLASIMVAMERERWMNMPRGKRHVWVNLAGYEAQIIDNGKVTFRTRAVVGANKKDRRSPEFSDTMDHMVINPTWNVPKSIAVTEYLPFLQEDPTAISHLRILDEFGEEVARSDIDFTEFDEENFPFNLKQPPSRGNALGLVKFMFPNRHNIYLHDTPTKNLFSRDSRAYSHGCIRLRDPFDFAYTLLRRQMNNPEPYFKRILRTGDETFVQLEESIPIHLDYRTALTTPKGAINFRPDVYGRDARIFKAMQRAGVVMRTLRS